MINLNKIIRSLPMVISYIISMIIFIQLNKKCIWFEKMGQKIRMGYQWQFVVFFTGLMFIIIIILSDSSKNILLILSGIIMAFILSILYC